MHCICTYYTLTMHLPCTYSTLTTYQGEMNAAMFMCEHSSLIEVRGANASMNMADHWHPLMSRSSGFRYFWWGLIVQDPEYVGRSGLEQEGFYAGADSGNWRHNMFRKRDQNVRVTWPHLSFLLGRIAAVDKNVTHFEERFGQGLDFYHGKPPHDEGVVFEVLPGRRLPVRHRLPCPMPNAQCRHAKNPNAQCLRALKSCAPQYLRPEHV